MSNKNNTEKTFEENHIIVNTSIFIDNTCIRYGSRNRIAIRKKYYNNYARKVKNPMFVLKLNNPHIKFDSTKIFSRIFFQIGGFDIEKHYDAWKYI